MSYRIELANGKVLNGVELSGSCWLTEQAVNEETFSGGLSTVKITGASPEGGESDPRGEYHNMTLDSLSRMGERTCFVLTESRVSETERLRSDVDYMAMMMGVEL